MVESIEKVLIQRDKMSPEEARKTVEDLRDELFQRLGEGEMPFDLMEEVGLEPDYLEELIDGL
jgi:polyhydroxyalkanoate synthesis regulator phasin